MAIFNSYVSLPEGNQSIFCGLESIWNHCRSPVAMSAHLGSLESTRHQGESRRARGSNLKSLQQPAQIMHHYIYTVYTVKTHTHIYTYYNVVINPSAKDHLGMVIQPISGKKKEDCLLFFRTSMSNVLVRFAPSELLGGSAEVKGTSCRIGPDGKAMELWSSGRRVHLSLCLSLSFRM